MFDWIYKSLIPWLIKWLTGQDVDFDKIVAWVRTAETTGRAGGEKATMVRQQMTDILGIVIPWVLNFLVELAVAYCKKQGWIK